MKTKYIIILFLIAFIYLLVYEPLFEKELSFPFSKKVSKGDCRIVNTIAATNKGYDLYLYKYSNSDTKHIIAVDKNDIIYDISRVDDKTTSYKTVLINGKTKKISFFHNEHLSVFENSKGKPLLELIYKFNEPNVRTKNYDLISESNVYRFVQVYKLKKFFGF